MDNIATDTEMAINYLEIVWPFSREDLYLFPNRIVCLIIVRVKGSTHCCTWQ